MLEWKLQMSMDTHERLIRSLLRPQCYGPGVSNVELIETHISWVLLAGDHAYKIKKPVNLGFVDFSTLAKRRRYCVEELRLNRRLAPRLYQAVVAITGSADQPTLGGAGKPLEYAVQMRRFPQEQLLDRLLDSGGLTPTIIDEVGRQVADFHARVAVAASDSIYGLPQQVWIPMADNFRQISALINDVALSHTLVDIEAWSQREHRARAKALSQRKSGGFIRECHGDMHLGNMALLADAVTIFDCIEFNPALRWIDVMSEVAFLAMDLDDRGHPDLGRRVVNRYLEWTGDYGGLEVLPLYRVYRAMVRAKVHAIRGHQTGLEPAAQMRTREALSAYLRLAEWYTRVRRPFLIITHGLSGSGKTTASDRVVEDLGAVRVRSDIERKRLAGLSPDAASGSAVDAGLYTPAASADTYARLEDVARKIVDSGLPTIVDATFLRAGDRERFRALARELHVPFAILACTAPAPCLRARIAQRHTLGHDASEATLAVLERQIRSRQPLSAEERACAVTVPVQPPPEPQSLTKEIARLLEIEAATYQPSARDG